MIELLVELSGENRALARAEAESAARTLEGRALLDDRAPEPKLLPVELPEELSGRVLAQRLALARRVLRPWGERSLPELLDRLRRAAGERPGPVAIRPLGHPRGAASDGPVRGFAEAWRSGGGAISLDRPTRRFFYLERAPGEWLFAEEVAPVDRADFATRRMPKLAFRRPVSLPPRLARCAANLAGCRPGARVADPFVGTGSLLLEAALLGARVIGADRDPEMVRGALRNLAQFGLEAERLVVADAEEAASRFDGLVLDAVVTDPPYGRASGTHGERPELLVSRVLPRWAEKVRAGGRVVVVLPGGPDPLGPPWRRVYSIPDRVHRSLTREFRVFERPGPA